MTFAREAWLFVLPIAAVAIVAYALRWPKSAVVLAIVSLLVLAFFRIPTRRYSGSADRILAPANGVVTEIVLLEEPRIGPGSYRRITTFLSVFNIHVQRAPTAGRVVLSQYQPGRKLAAFRPEAGDVNENHLVVLELADGQLIGIKQIAGLLARRVVSYLDAGQEVKRGELIGLIKFGSRVDLYLPPTHEVLVEVGDKLHEGLTEVARISEAAP